MSFSFQTKVTSRGFHVYKNTAGENVNIDQEISVQLETNENSKKIDPYCCAFKTMVSGKLEAVGHIPMEVDNRGGNGGMCPCFVNKLSSLNHP